MFDHSRHDWYPADFGGPGVVWGSNRQPRPALRVPLSTFAVHYGGAGTSWLDFGDSAKELRGVEVNHARPNGKPNEYNSASDSAAETWEYAGPFQAAHSAGNNGTTWGHLAMYGLEVLSEADAVGLIRGIRRARAQCVRAGWLTTNHAVKGHGELPKARTACPGPLFTTARWWQRIVAPLTPVDFDATAPTLPPPQTGDDDMPRVAYVLKPPRERHGQPWLYVCDADIREATSFDLQQGLTVNDLDTIDARYRVQQYDWALARAQRS
jgi:hypothetical protein